jgi:hypothetical protein
MNADKVGVARPPVHVVDARGRTRFRETLQRVGYCGGDGRFASAASAFICGKNFLLRCLLEFFWRLARMTKAHAKVRGATCLLSVKLCTHPVWCCAPERSTVRWEAVRRAVIVTREVMGDHQSAEPRSPLGGGLPRRCAPRNDTGAGIGGRGPGGGDATGLRGRLLPCFRDAGQSLRPRRSRLVRASG